jgi:hypothetical protein
MRFSRSCRRGRGTEATLACGVRHTLHRLTVYVTARFARPSLLVAGDEELFVGFAAGDAAFAGDLF